MHFYRRQFFSDGTSSAAHFLRVRFLKDAPVAFGLAFLAHARFFFKHRDGVPNGDNVFFWQWRRKTAEAEAWNDHVGLFFLFPTSNQFPCDVAVAWFLRRCSTTEFSTPVNLRNPQRRSSSLPKAGRIPGAFSPVLAEFVKKRTSFRSPGAR